MRIFLINRSLVVIASLLALIGIGMIIQAQSSRRGAGRFDLAGDFPRGALVYAQFKDFPALLKSWDESQLKDRYLQSTSYQRLQSRHLALKLVSRWEEWNEAAGGVIDLAALGGLADNRAALAVYDIGRLDLVLIAPLNDEKFAATMFYQGKDKFEELELPDGTTCYLHDVEADHGRQKQVIGFAMVKGRLVMATSERLLLRTVANLNGQTKKDRMTDEPLFQTLSRGVTPHFVTVWVDQARLNDDWYFRQYWVMRNLDQLKHIRAGIFDLDWQTDRWVEHREFLLNGRAGESREALSPQLLHRIERIIPPDMPFAQARALGADSASESVLGALFEARMEDQKRSRHWNWEYYGNSDFEVAPEETNAYGESQYSYLNYRYNLTIDDPDDAEDGKADQDTDSILRLANERQAAAKLQSALQPANPVAVVKLGRPRALDGLLFAEFGRAAVVTLQKNEALDRHLLELAIGELAATRFMIAGAPAGFEWRDRGQDGVHWREMQLPMLGRSLGYGVRGQEVIFSNHPALLTELMSRNGGGGGPAIRTSSPAQELTLIRLDQHREAFDQIFAKLDEPRTVGFFSGELVSLLEVASPVKEIRIQRSFVAGRMREDLSINFK